MPRKLKKKLGKSLKSLKKGVGKAASSLKKSKPRRTKPQKKSPFPKRPVITLPPKRRSPKDPVIRQLL